MDDATMQPMTLVTGGAGFIGSHLVEKLIARGDRVVVIDDLSTGSLDNLAAIDPDRLRVHTTTVARGLMAYQPGDFKEIYHLAAAVGVRLVIAKPVHTIETNIHETSAVLSFAARCATPTFIASTSEVYGKSTATPFREDDDVVYGPTIYNRWSYACSKAIDEYLALAHHQEDDLPVVVVRFFNTVGPRQVGHYGMVLPRFVAAALAGSPLQVYGDGEQSRCFCDVRDVVEVLPELMQNRQCRGRIFNLGSDEPITIRALADLVNDTLGTKAPIKLVPYEEAFGPHFDDLKVRVPDTSRIRADTGFAPRIPLRQTILDVADVLRAETARSMEKAR